MKKYFTIIILSLIACWSHAQNIVKGTVVDPTGGGLPGANILLRGTTIGTSSDMNGVFQIEIPAEYKDSLLVFSMVGFAKKEVRVGTQTNINVMLEEDLKQLSEIVITGYTSQEKGKITGAVTTVAAETLIKLPVPSIDQALQGRAPGVVVSQNTGAPGEGVAVRIRGIGSINSGNYPLYIVDGIPTLDISNFSTQDIESITVLKDASAAAVYGARAGNGVVIVTTKAGSSKEPVIQFSTQVGVQQPSRLIDMANTHEYVSIYNQSSEGDNATKTNPIFWRPLITEEMEATYPDVNYIDQIMQTALLQSHSLSISGQENKTQYFVSFNYFDQEGIIKSSNYNRLSGRFNIKTEVKSWLRTGLNLNIARSNTDVVGSSGDGAGGNGGSVIRYAFFRTPPIPVYDQNGEFTDKPERSDLFGDGYSPVGMLAYNRNRKSNDQMFGKIFFDFSLAKDLKFTSNLGFDVNNQQQRRFDRNWGTDLRINNPNQLSVWTNRWQTYTWTNLLTYLLESGDHTFNFLAGTEAIKSNFRGLYANERNFPDQEDNLVYLGNGLGQKVNSESAEGSALLSFFGKVEYDYSQKYLASVTLRRDGSSRFGENNRWGNFYAGSLGWRVDKESFLQNSKSVDRLLVRFGYGKIGNQEIGNYPYTDVINGGYNYTLGNAKANGYAVSSLGNSNVKWENSTQLNAGVDFAGFGGKLTLSLDYFIKTTTDLLVVQPLASSAGEAIPPWVNNGKVENRGIELAASYSNDIGKFHYTISGNAATLHNEVLEVKSPIADGPIGSDKITLTDVGHPIGSFYILEMEGIFQDANQIFTHAYQGKTIAPGDIMFKDHNPDGVIDASDRAFMGSPIPNVTAGLNINLSYQNFDFSMFFQGAYGQKIFSVLNRDIEGFYRAFNVTQRYYDNHWTGPGTSNQYPRASWDASGNNVKSSTRFLEDGSYTRLKNLQLGYTIPANALSRIRLKSLRIYISATNVLTFTKYSGMDPEMTVSDNSKSAGDRASGMDWGTYPSAKTYNLGLNLTL